MLCPNISMCPHLQVLHPAEHGELEAALKEAQSQGHLQDRLTQLKCAMDARGLHYDDLSGRPKNLCASSAQHTGWPEPCSLC